MKFNCYVKKNLILKKKKFECLMKNLFVYIFWMIMQILNNRDYRWVDRDSSLLLQASTDCNINSALYVNSFYLSR